MLILHQVTFTLYLLATITYYVVYASWNRGTQDDDSGNVVYITWAISVIMSAISQGVLIYIYWGLGTEMKDVIGPKQEEDEDCDEEGEQTEILAFDESQRDEKTVQAHSMLQLKSSSTLKQTSGQYEVHQLYSSGDEEGTIEDSTTHRDSSVSNEDKLQDMLLKKTNSNSFMNDRDEVDQGNSPKLFEHSLGTPLYG